jgi:hypothetical protein
MSKKKPKPEKEPETVTYPICRGTGNGQPIATGFESAGRINAWLMSRPCGTCDGTGKVLASRMKSK